MKRTTIFLVLLSVVFFACKRNKKEMLTGKWHAVKLENPDMDSFFMNSQKYIDTIGKGNDDSTNIKLYGVANMDSMRHILQQQYDSAKTMQMAAVTNTTFTFRKDSIVVLYFNGSVDSSRWYIDSKGALVLDKLNGYGPGEKISMDIVTLSDTLLKLRFNENNSTSTVTFHPDKN